MMRRAIWPALALALAVAAGCGVASGGAERAPKPPKYRTLNGGPGPLFLSGGADDPPALLARFRDLAGGRGASIAIVPFAGGPGAGEPYRKAFAELGVDDVAILDLEAPDAGRQALARAGGVYVVGGITRILVDRVAPFSEAIRAAWKDGAVVGGHSAGAMIVADRVIVKGEGPAALAHGLDVDAGGLDLRTGVGLLPGAIVDTHFGERARFPRLWVAAGATGRLGIGVDPGTAAVYLPDGTLTAYGTGSVTLIRPEGAAGSPARVSVLGPGDKAALADWRPEAAE